MISRPRRGLRAAALVVALAATIGALPSAAGASPRLTEARRRATALRTAVHRLEIRAAVATEDYDEAQVKLGAAVTAHLTAQGVLDEARAAQQASDEQVAGRLAALYKSGGKAAMYAAVLNGTDLHDALGRFVTVSALVAGDRRVLDAATANVRRIEQADARLAAIARQQTRLEIAVAAAAHRVEAALAEQRSLLVAADADVRQIAEQDRLAAEAAAARAFADRLNAARRAAGLSGLIVEGPALATLAGQTVAAPTATAARAIEAARSQLGKPYQWGATGPNTFDCSGLTGWAYREAGIPLPRTSRQQWYAGDHPDLAALAPGDLLFWGTLPGQPGSIHHVALYIGAGMMIAAPHTGAVVRVQPVYLEDYFGATRPKGHTVDVPITKP
ncbi:MAG: NlpC/P60 family protein [Mycobacteriales bacterium]